MDIITPMALDPEIDAYLEAQKSLPPRSALSLEQTRIRMTESARQYGGAVIGNHHLEDFHLPSGVRVRSYIPDDIPGGRAAHDHLLLYFHGGRFISGGLDSHDLLCRRLSLCAGLRVVSVDYRLAPEHPFPSAIDDALAAVDWALEQSHTVSVGGDSAGANIAAVLAAACRTRLRCQVLIYPMIDATRSLPSHVEFGQGFGPSASI